ncbi:hypothetical protein DJFAAGMI_04524 [Comamonas sp. PE63]|uniref:Uncharacterized protein n=1 Tax=Comamonas brasiliensis TaxID=1812482 RepID=A0ABS5LYZ1_9BURK|nr:hypothetical protein [Comamonas sp. PE63]MBS3021748.1 hypothetical protein [Comamonas sp. PE63]
MSNEQVLRPWPSETPVTVGDDASPIPPVGKKLYARAKLATANDIAAELARVYRAMKSGQLDPNVGTKLTYVLSTLAKLRMDSDIEARIEALEGRG